MFALVARVGNFLVQYGCGILYTAAISKNEPMMSFNFGLSYGSCQ